MDVSLHISLLDVLGRFEILLVQNQYIKERHPILLHAIAHARATALDVGRLPDGGLADTPGASLQQERAFSLGFAQALYRAVETLDLIAQAQDVNSLITVEGLNSLAQLVSLSVDASEAGDLDADSATLVLEKAIHAALHTRFEQTDSSTDQLVYVAIVELLRSRRRRPQCWAWPSTARTRGWCAPPPPRRCGTCPPTLRATSGSPR